MSIGPHSFTPASDEQVLDIESRARASVGEWPELWDFNWGDVFRLIARIRGSDVVVDCDPEA